MTMNALWNESKTTQFATNSLDYFLLNLGLHTVYQVHKFLKEEIARYFVHTRNCLRHNVPMEKPSLIKDSQGKPKICTLGWLIAKIQDFCRIRYRKFDVICKPPVN